jgi:hypothetical protein
MLRTTPSRQIGDVKAVELGLHSDRYSDLVHVLAYWERKRRSGSLHTGERSTPPTSLRSCHA